MRHCEAVHEDSLTTLPSIARTSNKTAEDIGESSLIDVDPQCDGTDVEPGGLLGCLGEVEAKLPASVPRWEEVNDERVSLVASTRWRCLVGRRKIDLSRHALRTNRKQQR